MCVQRDVMQCRSFGRCEQHKVLRLLSAIVCKNILEEKQVHVSACSFVNDSTGGKPPKQSKAGKCFYMKMSVFETLTRTVW